YLLGEFRWTIDGGVLLHRPSDSVVPVLSCCGRFFLCRTWLDVSSRFSARFPHFHGANAGRDGRRARNSFEICLGRSSQFSLSPQRHAVSARGPYFSTHEHHDRSCTGMQRDSIELGAFHDQHPGRQLILKDAMAAFCACHLRHSARHFAERISYPRDRTSLCAHGSADDSQSNPPPRRPRLLCACADSVFSGVVVAAQGRRAHSTAEIALSLRNL